MSTRALTPAPPARIAAMLAQLPDGYAAVYMGTSLRDHHRVSIVADVGWPIPLDRDGLPEQEHFEVEGSTADIVTALMFFVDNREDRTDAVTDSLT